MCVLWMRKGRVYMWMRRGHVSMVGEDGLCVYCVGEEGSCVYGR